MVEYTYAVVKGVSATLAFSLGVDHKTRMSTHAHPHITSFHAGIDASVHSHTRSVDRRWHILIHIDVGSFWAAKNGFDMWPVLAVGNVISTPRDT